MDVTREAQLALICLAVIMIGLSVDLPPIAHNVVRWLGIVLAAVVFLVVVLAD